MRTASSAAAAANHEYRSARVMMRSRLKCLRRCFGSKSLTCAAIRIFRSSSGKPPSGLTPDFPVFNPPQNSSTFVPIGVTTPRPVTTTRRPGLLFDISNDLSCLVRARQTFDGADVHFNYSWIVRCAGSSLGGGRLFGSNQGLHPIDNHAHHL